MDDESALHAAVRADVNDLTPRLVYADWLDERGDPDRTRLATYIRAECELLSLPFADPACRPWFDRLTEITATPGPVLGGWEYAPVIERVRQKMKERWLLDARMAAERATRRNGWTDPINEAELLAAERSVGFLLPADYRAFLLRIGTSGMGPDHGLRAPVLDRSLRIPFPLTGADVTGAREAMAEFTRTRDYAVLPSVPDAYDEGEGFLHLSDLGCGSIVALVVNGPLRGMLWELYPSALPVLGGTGKPIDFLAWYESWLDS